MTAERRPDRSIRSESRPLYLQVVRAIQELADEEGLVPGSPLPSEPDLATMFDVGRTTIREALVYLENERLIERSQGARTTLTQLFHQPVLGLEVLEPFELLAGRQGWTCGTRNIRIEASMANDEEAKRLGISAGSPVTLISRIKTLDGKPLALMESVVPAEVVTPERLRREFEDSITKLIHQARQLQYAQAEITALACTPELAQALDLQPGDPVILLEELFFADEGLPLAWNSNYLIPGRIRFELLRKVPRGADEGSAHEAGRPLRKGQPALDASAGPRR
jgi:GntR family transcriptional regulator